MIEIDFDPTLLSYADLLKKFWAWHNPCGRAWSRQYMSAILFHDDAQKKLALQTKAAFAAKTTKVVSTEIIPIGVFTRAEDYHQKYYLRGTPWLFLAIAGKVGEKKDFADSTAAARLNGWLGGHVVKEQVEKELPKLGLTDEIAARVKGRVLGKR